MRLISKERAFAILSSWGSFISADDPGACLYGFRFNDGRPANEAHRVACLTYVRTLRPDTPNDERELASTTRFLANCELRP